MRCLPVALRYHDSIDKLIRVSAQQAAITHADERCTWGAVAVNLAARELLHGNAHFVEEVVHRLADRAPRPLLEALRRVPWEEESELPIARAGEHGYVVHCVEIAFWCAVHRPSLEEALIFLAEAGGDTDTNAAVAGALLGAREGVPGPPPRPRQLSRATRRPFFHSHVPTPVARAGPKRRNRSRCVRFTRRTPPESPKESIATLPSIT